MFFKVVDPVEAVVQIRDYQHAVLGIAQMKRAMARQAEAERERRAKVIAAEGEFQAAERLSQAAGVITREHDALTLRTLQTLAEVATEHNSTPVGAGGL